VSRAFGTEFAAKVDALAPGQWSGPIESPYGLHLVLVTERKAPTRPALADVRPLVEREHLAERRKAQWQALYERLLQEYTVSIEMPKEDAKKQAAGTKPTGAGSGRPARAGSSTASASWRRRTRCTASASPSA
jgi:parvulin-like peptidyl-prolyl isomerase